MSKRPRIGFALVVLAAALATAAAADWPQWRGPEGNGVVGQGPLPLLWSRDENVAWRTRLTGTGVSTPVAADGVVYVTSQIGRGPLADGVHPRLVRDGGAERPLAGGEDDADRVVFVVEAFDLRDGRRRWTHREPAGGGLQPVHSKHNLASPSPVTDGERVYAWFGTGQLLALDRDGRPVWKRHLGVEIAPFVVNWGHASSPTLYEDLLILQCDHEPASYLLALDKRTGEERWRVDRGRGLRSYSTPTVVRGARGDELVVNGSRRLEGYDPRTGELLWYLDEPNRFPIPVPSAADGIVYTSRGYRSGPYMAIRTGGRGDVRATHLAWYVPTGAPYVSSLVHYEGLVFMVTGAGIARAIDARTGERVWQERLDGVFTASPIAGDGKVYFVSETGSTFVVRAARTFELLARNDLDERIVASPAVAAGRLLLRTDEHLYAIGAVR